jgi:prepilin signal peptidase PulO-like enzyme (type II secretory pathway)
MSAAALAAALTALLFALAGYAGAVLAEALCAGAQPYDDGPLPVAVGRIPLAVGAACAGLVFALRGTSPAQLAVLLPVVLALAGCAAADLRCGLLPDPLTLLPLAGIVGLGAFAHDWTPALGAAFVALPFAACALLTRGRGMGWGDVKLAALGGALLGAGGATLAFGLAALAAFAMARLGGALRRPIAFGPYLAASIAATLTFTRTF